MADDVRILLFQCIRDTWKLLQWRLLPLERDIVDTHHIVVGSNYIMIRGMRYR